MAPHLASSFGGARTARLARASSASSPAAWPRVLRRPPTCGACTCARACSRCGARACLCACVRACSRCASRACASLKATHAPEAKVSHQRGRACVCMCACALSVVWAFAFVCVCVLCEGASSREASDPPHGTRSTRSTASRGLHRRKCVLWKGAGRRGSHRVVFRGAFRRVCY